MNGPRIGSLFTGTGGLDMAVAEVFGATTAWVSDIKPAAVKLLAHRMPDVPNHGDITQIDWDTVEPVDIITGGFPCTDVSAAGKQAGLIRYGDGATRSGLWAQMCNAVDRLRPSLMIAENVRGLLNAPADSEVEPCPWCVGDEPGGHMRALGAVLADLADIGYDAGWYGLRASDVGACHGRWRVFIVAWPASDAPDFGHGWAGTARPRGDGSPNGDLTLAGDVTLLPTPVTQPDTGNGHARNLGKEVQLLPTPTIARRSNKSDSPGAAVRPSIHQINDLIPPALPLDKQFGQYAPAVARQGRTFGRPAPAPTETSPRGGQRLSPAFTEWMMGLPEGHITGVPGLSRNDQLSLCGDGVVPQQAAAGIRQLISHLLNRAAA